MTEAFKNNEDIHARTARDVFGAKTKEQESEFRGYSILASATGPYRCLWRIVA